MKILTIDPGRNCGLAYYDTDNPPQKSYQVCLGRSSASWISRLDKFSTALESTADGGVDILAVEMIQAPQGKRGGTPLHPEVIKLHRYVGVAALFAARTGAAMVEIAQNTWKKSLGKGNMSAEEARKAARIVWRLDHEPGPDEAAALGMLWCILNRYNVKDMGVKE
ncbi:MAG: hypothetical protein JRI34_00800 [Deltaproteobacteria bacterium]|nr:hypothetical protein [Deltaproteobacteria bacterium]